jgi:glycosyltransferase involved in cell wall biosynthesis
MANNAPATEDLCAIQSVPATPHFSVIVPVHNRARELAQALRSVLAQAEQEFEVIVVDDGSIDDPRNTIRSLCDPRIRYWHQDNRGGGAARNAGIDLARGRFVAFLDSDDRFLPDHLQSMRKLLDQTSGVVGYAPVRVERGRNLSFVKPPRSIYDGEHMATYLLCDRGFVPTITLVVETEMARRVRYDESLPYAQDADFAIRLYLAGCRFVMADAPGAVWNDFRNARRVSSGRKGARMTPWLERLKPVIPARAYFGARGWMIAKGLAPGKPWAALKLFAEAVAHRAYRPGMAPVIFLQVYCSDSLYRRLADLVVGRFPAAVWSRAARGSRS